MARTIKARRCSSCPRCSGAIREGDRITHAAGGWVCERCADSAEGLATERLPTRDWTAFRPSGYQAAIAHHLCTDPRHLIVEAVAGSGKTTTLEWLFSTAFAGQNALFCAFNASIARELRRRLGRAKATTLNAIGHRLVGRHLRLRLKVNSWKYADLAERYFPWRRSDRGRSAISPLAARANRACCRLLAKLSGLVRGSLTDPSDQASVRDLISHHGVEINGAEERLAEVLGALPRLLNEGARQAGEEGIIDFDDQLYLPHRWNIPASPVEVLCVDEAQDLNAAQHSLVLRLAGETGRVVAVGDSCQAIYGFRGALSDSLERLARTLSSTARGVAHLPLSICYRCPTSILDLAREIVPTIEAREDAPEGEVDYASSESFFSALDGSEGWLVLCRTNAPLAAAAFGLLGRGVRCRIQGRDIGRGLVTLLASAAGDETDLQSALVYLDGYVAREAAKLSALGRDTQASALKDRAEAIAALGRGLATVGEFEQRIKELFSDAEGAKEGEVVFSSIHRAKGLEHERVAILAPDLLPHPLAKREWERRQERNLKYVAITRSKGVLRYVTRPETEGGSRAPAASTATVNAPALCHALGGPSPAPLGIDPPADGEHTGLVNAAAEAEEVCTPEELEAAAEALSARLVSAIRADDLVGRGTATGVNEALRDVEIATSLRHHGIHTEAGAVRWARDLEGLRTEHATNARWGGDEDPQLRQASAWTAQREAREAVAARAADKRARWARAGARQEPVAFGGLPSWESRGDGSYTPPTLEDWEEVRDAYRKAGLSAELLRLDRWHQWALVIGGRIRVSTTVDCGNVNAREKGKNAIDITAVHSCQGRPTGGRKKVLRVAGWRGRVAERVNSLLVREGLAIKV